MSEIQDAIDALYERVAKAQGHEAIRPRDGEGNKPAASRFSEDDAKRVIESFGLDPDEVYELRDKMAVAPAAMVANGEDVLAAMGHLWTSALFTGIVLGERRAEART